MKEIHPSFSLHKLRLWNEYFFQWFKPDGNKITNSINSNEEALQNFENSICISETKSLNSSYEELDFFDSDENEM